MLRLVEWGAGLKSVQLGSSCMPIRTTPRAALLRPTWPQLFMPIAKAQQQQQQAVEEDMH